MDIPVEVLKEIKCGVCNMYLSRSPVYLQPNGTAACFHCFHPDLQAIRNTHYEATAKLLRFPCKYRDLGCLETVPFADKEDVIEHETVCDYRQYVCPVLGPVHCNWLGSMKEVLAHCMEKHNEHVLDNPCTLAHDIKNSTAQNYILKAFQMLFLLHTKLCVSSNQIYYDVRLLGDSTLISKFQYTLNIQRGDNVISRSGSISPRGSLELQESNALNVDIATLLNVFGKWDGVTFTTAVERRFIGKCNVCGTDVTAMVYLDEEGWRCKHCTPFKEPCMNKNQGCKHEDIYYKCVKHEWYFCDQSSECFLCDANISLPLTGHYISAHADITYNSGSSWRALWTGDLTSRFVLLSCCVGIGVCRYWLDNRGFELQVYIPVSSDRLGELRCTVKVTQPNSGNTRVYKPNIAYNQWSDWHVETREEDWGREVELNVEIVRVNPG